MVVVVTGGLVVVVVGGSVVVVPSPSPPWWWRGPKLEDDESNCAAWNARRLARRIRGRAWDRDVPPARWWASSACAPGPVTMTASVIAAPSAASWGMRAMAPRKPKAPRRRPARPRAWRCASCESVVTPGNVASGGNRTLDEPTTSGQLGARRTTARHTQGSRPRRRRGVRTRPGTIAAVHSDREEARGSSGVVVRVVTGGQSGVDRAATDVAISCGIPYGGWVPPARGQRTSTTRPGCLRGTRASSRRRPPIPPSARRGTWTRPTRSSCWSSVRGRRRARSSRWRGGRARLPAEVIDLSAPSCDTRLRDFVASLARGTCLNVAGPRESQQPGVYEAAASFLDRHHRLLFGR